MTDLSELEKLARDFVETTPSGFVPSAQDDQPASPSEQPEPVAWLYTESRWTDGPRHRLSMKRQAISLEDINEFEISEQPLYTQPVRMPTREEDGHAIYDWPDRERIASLIVDMTGAGTLGLTNDASIQAAKPIADAILALFHPGDTPEGEAK